MHPIVIGLLAFFFVFLQAMVADFEGNFSSGQQIARGVTNGFPFTRHWGMWSDMFLLPFVLAMMWQYRGQWSSKAILITGVISLIATIAMHYSWIKGTNMQEHILSPSGMTVSGYLHVVYMTAYLAIVMLFYFATPAVPLGMQRLVALLLGSHVAIGTMGVSYSKIGKFDTGSIVTTAVCAVLLAISAWK